MERRAERVELGLVDQLSRRAVVLARIHSHQSIASTHVDAGRRQRPGSFVAPCYAYVSTPEEMAVGCCSASSPLVTAS